MNDGNPAYDQLRRDVPIYGLVAGSMYAAGLLALHTAVGEESGAVLRNKFAKIGKGRWLLIPVGLTETLQLPAESISLCSGSYET